MAHFEIYILNFNGSRYLPECLERLRQIRSGEHSYTVNVVDNGSTDISEQLVGQNFPEVNFVPLGANYGFSKGNNLGVRARRAALAAEGRHADVHVLLNNDTAVEPNWLLGAADALERRPDAGIVGGKALFYDRFVPLTIYSYDSYCPNEYGTPDPRTLGTFLQRTFEGENIRTEFQRCKLRDAYPADASGCWLKQRSVLYVPIIDPAEPAVLRLALENHHPVEGEVRVRISAEGTAKPWEVTISRHNPERIELRFEPRQYQSFIQNAGSYVTEDWQGGDRGFLEPDEGHYEKEEEVASVCGVSMFVREKVWKQLGGFDERYFAYYEDTDLCLRARLAGWKCIYTPASRLRHVHCGSGVEFSEYFNKNVACSHLIFSSKMMSRRQWQHKRAECWSRAKSEFQIFKVDGTLLNKPHLAAYCRYIKYYPIFARNRMMSIVRRAERRLAAFPEHRPKPAPLAGTEHGQRTA